MILSSNCHYLRFGVSPIYPQALPFVLQQDFSGYKILILKMVESQYGIFVTASWVIITWYIIKILFVIFIYRKYKSQILGFCRRHLGFLFSRN
jgi:hypothetical protein